MNKLKTLLTIVFLIVVIIASQTAISAQTIDLDYNFHHGSLGWTPGFADYPPNVGTGYELFAGVRFMPRKLTRVPKRGFYIQGHNRSDDLFMFFKRRIGAEERIVANQTYRIQFLITFASNAPGDCGGIGGAPGDSVYLKAGASSIEPLAVIQSDGYLRMNVDIGNQTDGGTAASVAGNISNGIPCAQASPSFPFALAQRAHQHTTNVTANANGELWLLVGTDSGFEGLTRLYFQSIRVKLVSVTNQKNGITRK